MSVVYGSASMKTIDSEVSLFGIEVPCARVFPVAHGVIGPGVVCCYCVSGVVLCEFRVVGVGGFRCWRFWRGGCSVRGLRRFGSGGAACGVLPGC